MKKYKFIHTSDIHLGSILYVNGSPEVEISEFLRKATYKAFSRICRAAVSMGVRFIVISGDLYDSDYRSVRVNRFFVDACLELNNKGIEIIIISGNHDPLSYTGMLEQSSLFTLPENVHILGCDAPEALMISEDGEHIARIIGQSYKNKAEPSPLHKYYPEIDDNIFNIALLHTQLNADDKKYLPCTLNELYNKSCIHYWALGHIHKPAVLNKHNPVVAYAGIPQGRDFGEEDICGCYLVEFEGTNVTDMRFVPISYAVYKTIEIDIGDDSLKDVESLSELEDHIIGRISDFIGSDSQHNITGIPTADFESVEGYVLRVRLIGRGNLHSLLARQDEDVCNELAMIINRSLKGQKPFVWMDFIEIHTGSSIDIDAFLKAQPMFNELMDNMVNSLISDDRLKTEMISKLGKMWHVSDDHEDADELRLQLDSRIYESIIEDARRMIIEELVIERKKLTDW